MGRITSRHKVVRIDLDHGAGPRVEVTAVEEPLEIRVDDEVLTVTMRTPGNDIELAHGLLLAEGIIRVRDDVLVARYCADTEQMNVLQLQLRAPGGLPATAQRSLISHGGCGLCGKAGIDAVTESAAYDGAAADAVLGVPAERIAQLPDLLRTGQVVFDKTGGVHAAGLFGVEGEAHVIREDIGRHNAVDKITGTVGAGPGPLCQVSGCMRCDFHGSGVCGHGFLSVCAVSLRDSLVPGLSRAPSGAPPSAATQRAKRVTCGGGGGGAAAGDTGTGWQLRGTLPLCAEAEVALLVEARFRPALCWPPGT